MKNISIIIVALLLLAFSTPALHAEVTGNVYGAVVGKYLWRGQLLSDTYAIQPGGGVSIGGFTFDAWFSHQEYVEVDDVTAEERTKRGLCETDLTLTYENCLPWSESIFFNLGLITYILHTVDEPDNDSEEFFLGLSADMEMEPYLTLYYDDVLAKGAYLEAGASTSLSVNDWLGASVGLCAGYNFGQYEYESSLTVLGFVAGIDFTAGRFTVTPAVIGQVPLDSQYEDFVCGSLTVNYDFTIGEPAEE